jgi:hypothetical protein
MMFSPSFVEAVDFGLFQLFLLSLTFLLSSFLSLLFEDEEDEHQ